jgi:cell division inhibitor SepF
MGLFSKKKIESQTPKTTDFKAVNEEKDFQVTNQHQNGYAEFNEEHRTHFRPANYSETGEIADTLIRFKEVTVSFKSVTDKHEKRRIIDFLTGVMYGLDGSYKKVDDGIYYFWINNN